MEHKTCRMCHIEKHVNIFFKKHTECKNCKNIRSSKCYYENKDKTPNERNMYYKKNTYKLS